MLGWGAVTGLRVTILLGAVALLACAGPNGAATARLGVSAQRVVILPLNVAMTLPPELEGASHRVWNALARYVQAQGKDVTTVPLADARRLWLHSYRLTAAAVEATKGTAEETPALDFDAVARTFVLELGREAEFDALIMPSLFVQQARLSSHLARWDGVVRKVEVEGDVHRVGSIVTSTRLTGTTQGASLHVAILDPEGENLHEAQAGLVLLDHMVVGGEPGAAVTERRFHWEPRPDLFENEEDVREGIERALDPFLAPPPE